MITMNFYLINLLSFISLISGIAGAQKLGVQYMTAGVSYKNGPYLHNTLSIFCYRGVPKHLVHIWRTVFVSISLPPEQYILYEGNSPEEVHHMYEDHKSSWTSNLFSWRRKLIYLDSFNHSCLGVETSQAFEITVDVIRIDFWRVVLLSLGIYLFLSAPKLSSNPIFYYTCGVTLGITTSVFILLYLISKIIPKRPALYGFLIGGYAVSMYLLRIQWENIKLIAMNYQREVLGYIILSGIISFVLCYRFGPVTDPRSRNLIKWALQIMSLITMFYSCSIQEFSVLFILILLLYYNFPSSWSATLMVLWKRRFPPKVKLLTQDEYHEQGARETVKALNELRKYCSSPECKQWKTILSLSEPIRFAQFVEGKSHLADSEVLEYEAEATKSQFTQSDDDDSDDDY